MALPAACQLYTIIMLTVLHGLPMPLLLRACSLGHSLYLQASYDPNAVAAVLVQFPYHVDSLLAMNELYRSMGEAQVRD